MFTKFRLAGFKSFRNATIPLAPGITVFVGANNSGKSNALAALRFLGQLARGTNMDAALASAGASSRAASRLGGPWDISIWFLSKTKTECRYQIGFDGQRYLEGIEAPAATYVRTQAGTVEIPGVGQFSGLPGGLLEIVFENQRGVPADMFEFVKALRDVAVFDLSVASLRRPAKVSFNAQLGEDGSNLPSVLDWLGNERPDVRDAIENEVRSTAPEVKKLVTPTVPGDEKVVGIQETSGQVFRSSEMSDGLLLFIGLATAARLRGATPSLIAIEEPERGIHPRRLRDVVDYFRRIAQSGTQVVLTTHSPLLLDQFRDFPESVILFDRDEVGSQTRRISDVDKFESLLEGASLGEVWYSGLLGGIPKP